MLISYNVVPLAFTDAACDAVAVAAAAAAAGCNFR